MFYKTSFLQFDKLGIKAILEVEEFVWKLTYERNYSIKQKNGF